MPLLVVLMSILQIDAKEIEFTFFNSYDSTEQKAAAYVPDDYSKKKSWPLLVIAHYYGGSRFTARKQGYYEQAKKRGMLVVCPELHGLRTPGAKSLAALPAQHDVLDSIEYMKKHYKVDESRIYLAGRSMGGQMAMVLGAKKAPLFAAVMAGQGVSDMLKFYETTTPALRKGIEEEMLGPPSEKNMFEYRRRSAINYARNLKYVPFMMWHGTNDKWVIPAMSLDLFKAIRSYNPFQPEVNWLLCASHCAVNYTPEWICDKLQYYQNVAEAGTGLKRRFFSELNFITDEDTDFFWITVKLKDKNKFCKVDASLKNGALAINVENASVLKVNLDKIAKTSTFSRCGVTSDNVLTFTVTRGGKTVAGKIGDEFNLLLGKK
jgi:dienelactone hydrolase